MPATLNTLRIGETITVRATPRNPDASPGLLVNTSWASNNGSIASVVEDSGDPYLAHVTGVASGATQIVFYGEDAFTIHSEETDVTVLAGTRFKFNVSAVTLAPDPVAANIQGLTIEAVVFDVRDDPDPPDYGAGLTDILWTTANGALLFGGIAGGSPPGTATLADTLKAEVFPDVTSGNLEQTSDTITVVGTLPSATVITGDLPASILRTTTIDVSVVPSS